MTYQQTQTASEPPSDGETLLMRMLQKKMHALSKGIMVTDNFISDIENFQKRNLLSSLHEEFADVEESCPRCLKAYMFVAAREHGLSPQAVGIIEEFVPGEEGHNGYYLDEGRVRPARTRSES